MSDVQSDGPAESAVRSGDASLTFFTWNVHLNDATLELACKHLSHHPGTCIAAFQEVPHQTRAEQISSFSAGKLRLLTALSTTEAIEPSHHVILVGSAGIEVDPTRSHEIASAYDSERRMQGLRLFSKDEEWTNLQVLGIHGPDRRNSSTETERMSWARDMNETLKGFWTKEEPLVILGDLNANPFHDEITSREGLYAFRKKDGLGKSHKISNQLAHSVSLYNPMWHLLPDSAERAHGTYYFRRRTRTELLWHCIDQIIVSAHLEPYLSGLPQILTSLTNGAETVLLLDDKGVPHSEKGDPIYSDHLPVQLSVDIKQVESCRISAKP